MADARDDQASNEMELVNNGGMLKEVVRGFGLILYMCKYDLSHVLSEKVLGQFNTAVGT